MNKSLNLSEAIECIKNIVDSVRCTICDKAEGGRARYPCGHTICDGCLTAAEGCMLCLTPPSTLGKPVVDVASSHRAKNACNLLRICQDTFNLDVYRRLRISEQLKAEKKLFPDCIQAPVKYSNKRKSLPLTSNKENILYPGENISQTESFKMNNSNNYVKQWLNKSEKHSRKALADLNVNRQNYGTENVVFQSTIKRNKILQPVKDQYADIIGNKNRKRTYSNNSFSLLDEGMKSDFNVKKKKVDNYYIAKDNKDKTILKLDDNDESGIVLDDEPITIQDSQSQMLDKDALALLAVQAADVQEDFSNKTGTGTVSLENRKSPDSITNDPIMKSEAVVNRGKTKVQFFQKSALSACCIDCKKKTHGEIVNGSDNVTVTIENNSFVATINISKLVDTASTKNSVHVQTEISEAPVIIRNDTKTDSLLSVNQSRENIQEKNSPSNSLKSKSVIQKNHLDQDVSKRILTSPNIFELYEDLSSEKRCIIIDESESDDSSLGETLLQVTAEVHRSCEPLDYGILSEIDTNNVLKRPKKKVRSATPDSNNSSDKENCDPNKRKKRKVTKKNIVKKYQ